ncbi:MAG: hypothetical protein H6Q15_247 [Bacteroidetes bacterium]|mgnify:CR=1 FL=1|nr:hypothetical protein [Bacteroidota bacterium]
MEIIGKLVKVLPEETGNGKNGQWVKGAFVIETEGQYPKKVHFTLWGEERVASIKVINPNDQIKVYFDVESREFNERWYTDLRCFRIDSFNPVAVGAQPMAQPQVSQPQMAQPVQQVNAPAAEYGSFNTASTPEDDDLPF